MSADERVVRILGDALCRPTEHDGRYLLRFDVDAHDGRGEIETTPDIALAMRFPSPRAALEAWKTVSHVRPTRPDGKTNRPLTAFTVEVLRPDVGPRIDVLGWLLVWTGDAETAEDAALLGELGERLRAAGCSRTQGGNDYLAGYGPAAELDRVQAWASEHGPPHWRTERVAPWASSGPRYDR
jgi:hypothetical protein